MSSMSWFARMFLGAPRAVEDLAPVIDLERRAVCGLTRADTRTTIEARLGPPDDFWLRRKGQLVYRQLGLQLTVGADGALTGFSVFFDDALRRAYRWEPGGLRAPPTERGLVDRLGPPAKRATDDEEVMLEWERADSFLGVDFTLAGELADVFVDYT